MNEKYQIGIFFIICGLIISYFIWIDPIYYLVDIKTFLNKTPAYFLPTLILSILGLFLALKNYFRKSGANVSGWFGLASGYEHSDSYIHSILLLNNKDKPLIISNIFLRLGRNIYIRLNDEDNEFLTLKSYEVIHHKLVPKHAYFSGMTKIKNLETVLRDRKTKKRVVLDTMDGLVVCKPFKRDSVLGVFFRRIGTGYIQGYGGALIDGKPMGDKILYYIDLVNSDGYKSFTYISTDKEAPCKIKGIDLDKELLWSENGKKYVEDVLKDAKEKGIINWQSFTVHSRRFDVEYTQSLLERSEKALNIADKSYYHNIFQHYIVVPIASIISDYKLKLSNRKLQKKNRKKSKTR